MENPINKWMIWGNIHMVLGHIPKWMDGLFHGKIPIKIFWWFGGIYPLFSEPPKNFDLAGLGLELPPDCLGHPYPAFFCSDCFRISLETLAAIPKGIYVLYLLPQKFNIDAKNGCWKMILSYWVSVAFQGRTVKLQEGMSIMSISILVGGFNQPIWKICSSNWIMKPQVRKWKIFETTT